MREIKFRAWNEKKMKMSHAGVAFNNGTGELDYFPALRVMQYTGLKDDTGKEIYESDIVRHRFEDYEEFTNYKIVWSKVECAFRMEEMNGSNQTMYVSNHSAIIGNIYENPELLSDNK